METLNEHLPEENPASSKFEELSLDEKGELSFEEVAMKLFERLHETFKGEDFTFEDIDEYLNLHTEKDKQDEWNEILTFTEKHLDYLVEREVLDAKEVEGIKTYSINPNSEEAMLLSV